jgi:NitT/TauT family transport system substrate-binding protein
VISRFRIVPVAAVLAVLAACGGRTTAATPADPSPVTLRVGYFPNLTHAPAILGLADGAFAAELGPRVRLQTQTFNAGPAAVEALFAGAIDIAYVGPNPAINAFQKSKAVRIIAGAASGGAALVVKPSITSASDLKGKKLASPQRGNTQDVALRTWLAHNGLSTTLEGGGDVQILPQDNAQTLETFRSGRIDGAWVPEPWATRLVVEGGGKILVDEATLWPGGKYATTEVVARTQFLNDHPDVVKRFLAAHVDEIAKANANAAVAQTTVNAAIKQITGKALSEAVLSNAWGRLTFTYDPLLPTLRQSAQAAKALGLLASDDVTGIADLTLLNQVLRDRGKPPVT